VQGPIPSLLFVPQIDSIQGTKWPLKLLRTASERSAMAQAAFAEIDPAGSDDRAGLRDFWSVYDAQFAEISAELTLSLARNAEIGPLIAQMSPEERASQDKVSRELLRKLIFEDAWEPYLENLRTQGAFYARGGLGFSTWYVVIGEFRRSIQPRLAEAYLTDPPRLLRALEAVNTFTEIAMGTIGEAYLGAKEQVILEQQIAIQELSTPILPLREGLLLLPLVGIMDSHRARQVTENLLNAIGTHRARAVVIDITGVPAVDSMVANHLIQTTQAARLMGTTVVITGISTENAQTLVRIGIDPGSLNCVGDIQSGLEAAARLLAPDVGDAGEALRR
jgi:rsbT co-antagonist protein RsbR